MQSRWFWKRWSQEYRWIGYVVSMAFILSLFLLWTTFFRGSDDIIHWEKLQEQKILETTVHSFQMGPFELSVPGENYVIFEFFNGSKLSVNSMVSYCFTFVLMFCAMMILTIITTLERFWYFVGMGLFILFVVSLRLDVLNMFGQRNQLPSIAVLSAFTFLSFYFHTLRSSVSFRSRLLSFMALTVITGLILYFFSGVYFPMLHLAVTGYTPGLILSMIFIFMVAHEIPASFIVMTSQGNSKSLRHFSIINAIYLFNVIITGLHEVGFIQWNFMYLNPYLLLSVSAILGFWGFRQREPLYENIISFAPFGAYFYLSLGAICFATTAYLLGNGNDAALRIVRDAILFSHVGYGVIFFLYVISNFVSMLAQNMPVHKVLYKPNRMPYFTFRLAGLIMVLGFAFYSNWHEYVYHSISGFYNNLGDLYQKLGRSATAEAYYEQSSSYGFRNNHANYALGALKASRFDLEKARYNYELANGKRHTEFSLINVGNLYIWENKPFNAIQSFRDASNRLPHAGTIDNNLGFAYAKIHSLDSSAFYLNEARGHTISKTSAEINFFGLAAMEHLPIKIDSILTLFNSSSPAVISNAMALATVQHQNFSTAVDLIPKEKLDLYSATLLNNYIIRNAKTLDTTFVRKAFQLATDSVNLDFNEAIKSSLAFAYYHQGHVFKALQILGEMSYISQRYSGKYNYIMGLWALEQSNPELAESYFNYAVQEDYKQANLYKAIALSENQQVQQALVAWDTVANRKDGAEKVIAARMKKVLNLSFAEAQKLDDPEKYQFCRYRLNVSDTAAFHRIINTFQESNYKAKALLDMAQRQFAFDELPTAIRYFNRTTGLKLTDKNLHEEIRHFELLMLAERRELPTLAIQINKGIDFGKGLNLEKIYFTALFNEASQDTVSAAKNFTILATYNPYFEEGIIAAASFFRMHGTEKMKPYQILVEALQLNKASIKLLKAYAAEAMRVGFDEYAYNALARIEEIKAKNRRKF